MEGLFQMFQKKIKTPKLLALLALMGTQTFANDLFQGQSGEIISIPAAAQEKSDVLTFKTSAGTKQLVSLPFVKQDLVITRHHVNVKVNWVNFGESRITIADESKVTLSKEDQARANKEAIEIRTALSNSTREITPSFDFVAPVPGIETSPFGKHRFVNGLP
mgnify:FL=1